MANRVVTKGLLRTGQQTFESTNYNAARNVQVMSVDDSTVAIAAGDTAANTGGAITNFFDKVFDATPTETAPAVITCVTTFTTSEAIFTIKRILLHDDVAGTVTASSSSLYGGVDAQSLVHTADFQLVITMKVTYTNV